MAEPIWLSTTEVGDRMGLSPSWVRRRSPIFQRTHPSGIRQVEDKLGNLCWEWEVGFLELLSPKRNKKPYPKRNKTKQIKELETPTTSSKKQPTPKAKAEVLSGTKESLQSGTDQAEPLELGAHPQEDGTIAQVFTQEEYDQFYKVLSEAVNLKASHNQLKQSHEAHLESYEARIAILSSDIAYLRSSLDKQQELTKLLSETHLKSIQGIRERNSIEAMRIQEQKNPIIVLPKE